MVRIDPDGQLDDWYKEDDEFKWDDRVTDQKTAEKLHGGKAIYVGKEATISSVKNGKIMDKVGLHADGTVTKGGKRLAINSTMRFSNASGSSFQSRQTQGSFFSIGVDGALIGGFGFQVGLVSDAVGDTSFFINFNANVGFGGGAGWDAGTISPTGNNQFLTSDFDGNSGGYNVGISTPILDASWGKGGSVDNNWHATNKVRPSKFGDIQRGYKTEQSGFGVGTGIGAGAMYSYGTTKVF